MFALYRNALTLAIATFLVPSQALAAPPDRIQRSIQQNRFVRLPGSVHPRVAGSIDRGVLDPATRIAGLHLILQPTAEQQTALEQLLEEQRDPASVNYQKWLSPEEYGETFGVSASDLAALSAWLQSQGFTVDETARASNWISFSGSAGTVGAAFHTELHRFQADAEIHFANATEIALPEAVASVVDSVRGLNDFRPRPQRTIKPRADFTSSNSAHYLAPDDVATIYDIAALYNAGFDGTGQKLAIAGQTDINIADIRAFRTQFGLPVRDPQLVLDGPDPGVSPGDQIEADLDLEWSGAIARNTLIIYVYSRNVFDSVQYAIDKNLAPVISMSYGSCEVGSPASYRTMAQQANAQGITWMNSSGDSGAAGCDYNANVATQGPAVTFPADIPEVTAVGGTEFNETAGTGWNTHNSGTFASATGSLPEKAWNDTAQGNSISASGGGASATFRKPWWQTGPGVPNDNNRDVPDVSLSASASHDGYLLYAGGTLQAVGGTSASSPVFAAIVTILNQYLVTKGAQAKAGVGNINPNLYSLAQTTSGIFHDVILGDNIVPCKTGTTGCTTGSFGYKAGPGYDLVTGLGSVDAFNLVTKWTSLAAGVGTTMSLTANPATIAQSASTQLTATVKPVTGSSMPTGTVTFASGNIPLGSAALASGSAVISVKGTTLGAGTNSITANYAATGTFTSSAASTTVTVTIPLISTTLTLTASPLSIMTSGFTVLTAGAKAASGSANPAGIVTFTAAGKTLGTATLVANGSAVLTVNATALAIGSNSIAASYAGSSTFSASSAAPATVTVTVPAVPTLIIISATPAGITPTGSTVLTATVKVTTGTAVPTGTVNFTRSGTAIGSAPLAAVNGAATATLTLQATSLVSGANPVTATYPGATGFATSSASAIVTVSASLLATTTTLSASPATLASNGTTTLTATVKAATGTTAPGGTVTLSLGAVPLGLATLSTGGTASLTIQGTSLATGTNTISATYSGAAAFSSSSGSLPVVVTAPAASAVVVSAVKGVSQQPGFPVVLQVREQSGVASTLTGLTVNGTDFSSAITAFFGSAKLSANGTLTANIIVQWTPMPANLVFVIGGIDSAGHKWSQASTVATSK